MIELRFPDSRKFPWTHFVLFFCLAAGVCASSNGFVRGNVRNSNGEPVEGIRIRVYDADWVYNSAAATYSASDGVFITGSLEPGYYFIRAVSIYPDFYVGEYWPDSFDRDLAVPIRVESGITVSGIDFSLQIGGYLKGNILNSQAESIEGVDLDIYSGEWEWLKGFTDTTDDHGNYRVGPVPPGTYFVRADPALSHGCIQAYWPDAYYRDDAQFVAVYPMDEIAGLDFRLNPGTTISGIVNLTTGSTLPDCEVEVYSLDWIEQPIHQAISDTDGAYTAFGLPEGSYFLKAKPNHGCGYQGRYYPDSEEKSGAVKIAVTLQEPAEGIHFTLGEGNFDLTLSMEMPSGGITFGNEFYAALLIDNDGPLLEGLPVFFLLEVFDAYYFWPGWQQYQPPEYPFIDYRTIAMAPGNNQVSIIDTIIWPGTGSDIITAQFYAAVTNRTLSGLASNLESGSWQFE